MIAGIWAEDAQGLIGVNGTLPWSLPAELRHFKATTMGQAILMGRKTFDGNFAFWLPLLLLFQLSFQPFLKPLFSSHPLQQPS